MLYEFYTMLFLPQGTNPSSLATDRNPWLAKMVQTKHLFNLDESWGIGVLWTYSSIYHLFLLIAQVRISFGKSQENEVKWI